MAIADFSESNRAVNVNLAAGIATKFTGSLGTITTAAPMLVGAGGFDVVPLITVGETLPATSGALNPYSAGGYTPVGNLDGLGAFRLDTDTVRVFANHEVADAAPYRLSDGAAGEATFDGARITYFDLDVATTAVIDAGIAIRTIRDRDGEFLTEDGLSAGAIGPTRFCSSVLVEPFALGEGRGLADRTLFAGEESSGSGHGGSVWALDTATGDLRAVPAMGRGHFENVAPIDTGDTSHVAFLLTDDAPAAALYLYVGTKHPGGDYLDRNGLSDGQLYVWTSDTGELSPSAFPSGTRSGSFLPVPVRDADRAGEPGYDADGYLDEATLASAADDRGAFSFRRPEDVDANPANPGEAVFATTGIQTSSDNAGTVYTVTLDFEDIESPAADISIVYNANFDPLRRIRNPDNLDWSADGFVYVQEDRASSGLFGPGAVNPHEASILRLDPATGTIVRVAEVDRSASGPFGATDNAPTNVGAWETSGIVDVSAIFDRPPGTLFLADIQAHSIVDGPIATGGLVAGGQLAIIAAPGAGLSIPVKSAELSNVDTVVGSPFADTIIGDALTNLVRAGNGGDRIDGGAGDDRIHGGRGKDLMLGRDGDDRMAGGAGADDMTGGDGRDIFVIGRESDLGRNADRTDIVRDFEAGLDQLDFAGLDARPGKGNQAFRWIGEAAFDDRPGALRYESRDRIGTHDDIRVVEGDIDGDGRPDFRLVLSGLGDLGVGDIVL